MCDANPELAKYGFYRKLNNGQLEFMSICKKCTDGMKDCSTHWLSVFETDFNNLLDEALPKQK